MADFSITIANRVNTFGPAPSNKWNAWTWNAFLWGEGTTGLATDTLKAIGNALAPTDDFAAETAFVVAIANALAMVADAGSEVLTDAAGFTYVFPDRVTDADDRALPTYTAASAPASGWTAAAAASTTWS